MIPGFEQFLEDKGNLLIATDFDGTLSPIGTDPSAIHLSPETQAVLARLHGTPGVTLAVISGRELEDLKARIPLPVILAGNHGLEIEGPDLQFHHPEQKEFRAALALAVQCIREAIRPWPEAWVEDKGASLTIHYRLVPRGQMRVVDASRSALLDFGRTLKTRRGKKALEVLPKLRWNKGSALRYIVQRLGPFDGCLCLGDDRTDETMFRARTFAEPRRQFNIRVGPWSGTRADTVVDSPQDVARILDSISGQRRATSPR